jgi:short-subunit dehydrogenase
MLVQIDTSDEKLILKAANKLEGNPIDLLINNTGVGKLIVWMTRPRRSS